MLTELRIQNFKSWRDTGAMRFAPLTGFFGPNSSGKTSILQFLLMLKQTVESNQRSQVLEFGSNTAGKNFYVNLGTFTDITFRQEVPGKISFEIIWNTKDNYHYDLGDLAKEFNSPEPIFFTADIEQDKDYVPRLSCFSYKSEELQATVKRQEHPKVQNQNYKLLLSTNSTSYNENSFDGYGISAYKFYGFPSHIPETSIVESANLDYFNNAFEDFFYGIRYLGPVRMEPDRIYFWSGLPVDDIGTRGEQTIQALLHASRPLKNPIDYVNEVQTDAECHVAKWLKQLKLANDFELRPLVEGRPEYEVRIRQTENSPEVLLTEVGFGVSQVLPVLTLCYYVPEGSTIILEQPEIHLHPAVQADLADVFIDVIKNRGVQIILESHSEHLFNRLQRRMAEEQLVPSDVALYFTHMENGESKLEELKIDEYGNISNWPENFFGDEMGDLVAMAEAAMQRQMQQQDQRA